MRGSQVIQMGVWEKIQPVGVVVVIVGAPLWVKKSGSLEQRISGKADGERRISGNIGFGTADSGI
jgi:hypothetical protein